MSDNLEQPRASAHKHLWTITKIALAVALATIVLLQTNLHDTITTLQHASIGWLLVAVVAFLLNIGLLAQRAWHLLGKRVPFWVVLESTIVQTSVGNLVATGAGMIAYVSLLRQHKHAPIAYSVTSLILARFADVAVLSITLGALVVFWADSTPVRWLAIILCGGGFIGCAIAITTLWRHEWVIRQIRWVGSGLGLLRFTTIDRAINTLDQLAEDHSTTLIGPVICYSIATQAMSWLFFWACLQTFNLAINPWASLLILSFTQLIAVIPVQVLGGLGVFDATTIYMLGLFHISAISAAPVLVGLRIIFYLCNLLLLLFPLIEARLSLGSTNAREVL